MKYKLKLSMLMSLNTSLNSVQVGGNDILYPTFIKVQNGLHTK